MTWDELKPKVNGVYLPTPVGFNPSLEDLDGDSFRDVKYGVLNRTVLRSDVNKLSLTFGYEDLSEISTIINLLKSPTLSVEMLDIHTLTRKTYSMYCNKKSFTMINANGIWVNGLSIELVEY